MDNKEKVLTLASAARKVGMDPEELRELIYEGKLDAVETEGGNLLIGEESLKGIIKEIETTEITNHCLLYTSPSPRDQRGSRMPSSA